MQCPYLLGTVEGKSGKSWHYILDSCRQQTPSPPTSKLRLLKDRGGGVGGGRRRKEKEKEKSLGVLKLLVYKRNCSEGAQQSGPCPAKPRQVPAEAHLRVKQPQLSPMTSAGAGQGRQRRVRQQDPTARGISAPASVSLSCAGTVTNMHKEGSAPGSAHAPSAARVTGKGLYAPCP